VWLVYLLIAACPGARGQDDSSAAAVPYTGRERLDTYVERTFLSKSRLAFLLVDTAEDHLLRQPRGWELGSCGWATRLGSNYGRRLIRNTIELGAGALLSEDTRYVPSAVPGIAPRVRHAVVSAFTARSDSGRRRPAYGMFAAMTATAFIVSVWQPRAVSPGHVMRGVSFSLLDRVPDRLLDEFAPDMKRFGKRVWHGTVTAGRSLLPSP
jgi:hypothetical protein